MENNIRFSSELGDDFYSFINKEWLENTKIPDDHQRWSTFQELSELTLQRIKEFMYNQYDDVNYQKIVILFNQYSDINQRANPRNYKIIKKIIRLIKLTQNPTELFNLIIRYDLLFGLSVPLSISIQSDFNNANYVIPHLFSDGLGLPDRDFYFLKSKKEIRKKYILFIKEYSSLFPFSTNINPKHIFDLEKLLASKMYTRVQRRDVHLLNNVIDYSKFIELYPNLTFYNYLFQKTKTQPGQINITNPEYVHLFNDLIYLIDLNIWKNYFIFKILLVFHNYLDFNIEQCYFNFYHKTILGIQNMKPLWKRSLALLNNDVGELIGKLYANKYFDEKSKEKAIEIFKLIKNELHTYLLNNDWMESITKQKAINKLNNLNIKIGYPDVFEKDYNKLYVTQYNTLLKNVLNIKKFNIRYQIKQLYKPLNRNKWLMNAHSVNAYYASSYNEIVFPAGILQKPFFFIDQDHASNFGGFGMVIGHEITHGFDDEGSKFDEYGNLNNWWTKNDLIKYKNKIAVIKKQYEQYTIEGEKVNGKLTLGENIADLGGFMLSLKAFQKYLKDNNIPNYDEELRKLFISYCKLWKYKSRKEDIVLKLITDPHSPPILRVNGVVRNIPEFYVLFNITPSHTLYLLPEQRATLWS